MSTPITIHDIAMIALLLTSVGLLIPLGRRWHRRRQAARLADLLLANVLREKYTFRK